MERHIRRILGRTRLEVPPIVLGTMARRPVDPVQRKALFHRAIELGIDTFDTAPLYGFGDADLLLGEVLQAHREPRIKVLTKVGLRWSPDSRGAVHFQVADGAGGTRVVRRDARPEAVRRDVEESLRRLGVDVLDLVQVHFRDADTPIGETMGALVALRQEGKLREIGVSNFTLDEVRTAQRALGEVPLAAVQVRLNLLQRDPLQPAGVVPWCMENGVGVLAYSPLAEGRLAKGSATGERSSRDVRHALQRLAARAEAIGTSMASLSIDWLARQPGVTAAIVGVSTEDQLRSLQPTGATAEELASLPALIGGAVLRESWERPRWRRALSRLWRGIRYG